MTNILLAITAAAILALCFAAYKYFILFEDIALSLLSISKNQRDLAEAKDPSDKNNSDQPPAVEKETEETLNAFFGGFKIDENRYDVKDQDGLLVRVKERKIFDDMLTEDIIDDSEHKILF